MPLVLIFSSKNNHLRQMCPGAGVTVSEQNSKKNIFYFCVYITLLGRHTYKWISILCLGCYEVQKKKLYICIYHFHPLGLWLVYFSCTGALLLHAAFLWLWWGGYSSLAMCGLLTLVASLVVEHGLSCAVAREIFLDQRSNPRPCTGRQILNHWTTR